MQYKCDVCNDTGSLGQDGYLNCGNCAAADDRVALNTFVRSLGVNLTLDERTWAIHQRALAMAPKQEAPWDSFDIERTGDEHIDASGFLLTAAMEWWYASRKAKVNGAVKWLEGEDGSLLIFTRGEYRDKLMENIDAYGCEPVKFFNDKQPSTPAAANGAIPELPDPLEIYWPELHSSALGCGVEDRGLHDRYECAEYGWQDGVDKAASCVPDEIYDADQMRAYGKACAAAGPDAALVKALESALAIINNEADPDEYAAPLKVIRAALPGAKGN